MNLINFSCRYQVRSGIKLIYSLHKVVRRNCIYYATSKKLTYDVPNSLWFVFDKKVHDYLFRGCDQKIGLWQMCFCKISHNNLSLTDAASYLDSRNVIISVYESINMGMKALYLRFNKDYVAESPYSHMAKHNNVFRSMMTSSNGNIFCVTGPLCGEFIGLRWIPRIKSSDVELWCFLWSSPNYAAE